MNETGIIGMRIALKPHQKQRTELNIQFFTVQKEESYEKINMFILRVIVFGISNIHICRGMRL